MLIIETTKDDNNSVLIKALSHTQELCGQGWCDNDCDDSSKSKDNIMMRVVVIVNSGIILCSAFWYILITEVDCNEEGFKSSSQYNVMMW